MSSINLRSLGPKLKRERGGRGIREVANEIGISPATLSRVERGKLPDLDTFALICKWLKIDPADVLGIPTSRGKDDRLYASAHFRANRTPSPELAEALANMILATQEMLSEEHR